MTRKTSLAAATVLAAALSLTACGNDDAEANDATAPAAETQDDSQEQPASDIQASVDKVVTALDDLGIEHTDPQRKEVGSLSGSKASFDIDINGQDAGILVFPDAEAQSRWQENSDMLGGVHVAFDNAALSLNSKDGINNSVEIAPQIADKVGGTARGI